MSSMGYTLFREHSAKPFHLRLADDCKRTNQSTHMSLECSSCIFACLRARKAGHYCCAHVHTSTYK